MPRTHPSAHPRHRPPVPPSPATETPTALLDETLLAGIDRGPLPTADIASWAGAPRERCYRRLRQLERRGLVTSILEEGETTVYLYVPTGQVLTAANRAKILARVEARRRQGKDPGLRPIHPRARLWELTREGYDHLLGLDWEAEEVH